MPSIYEQIGGAPAVAAAVDDLYVGILGDPGLAHYFDGVDMARQKSAPARVRGGRAGRPRASTPDATCTPPTPISG